MQTENKRTYQPAVICLRIKKNLTKLIHKCY